MFRRGPVQGIGEERKDISLGLGHVSMAPILGSYYIDMRPALVHYTENLYGGGFDARGVPRILGPSGVIYFPINILQYCFILHADWLETASAATSATLLNCLEVLEERKSQDDRECVWWHYFRDERYGIEPPWASAMAQGEAISLYLRLYQALGRPGLLDTAMKSYEFMTRSTSNGGVRRYDEQGNLWFEEYPSNPPSYVLNGFIYAVFGLYDLYRVTGDHRVKADIDACIDTLVRKLPSYDSGYWSNYDLQKRELVRYYYQKNVHVPQLAVLYELTREPLFRKYKNRWQKQLSPLNFLFVRIMYRVRPRLSRIRRLCRRA
jgi:hypothetical protein